MKIVLNKEQVKNVIKIQFTVIAFLTVIVLYQNISNSFEKQRAEITREKESEITALQTKLEQVTYLNDASERYLKFIRRNNLDLYYKDRETNNFYGN